MGEKWLAKITRDAVMFTVGLVGVVHETLIYSGQERGQLLIVFGGMMGLPAFLRKDEKAKAKDE